MKIIGLKINDFGQIKSFEKDIKGNMICIYLHDLASNYGGNDIIDAIIALLHLDFMQDKYINYKEILKKIKPNTFLQGRFKNGKDIFTINLIATIDSPYYYKREILFNGIPLLDSSTRSADILTSVFLDYVFPRKVARNSFFNLNLSNYYLKLIESSLKGEMEIGDWSYYHRISIEEFLDVANESCNGDNILKNLQIDNHCRLKRTELFDFNCEEEICFNFQCFLVYNKLLQIVCEMEEEDSNYPLFIDRFFDFIDKDYLVFIEELRKTDRQVFIFTQYRDSKIPGLCDEFY